MTVGGAELLHTHTHIHNILRQYLLYIDGHIQHVYLFCTLCSVCVSSYIFIFQLFITDILICNLFNDSLRRALNSVHQVWEFRAGGQLTRPYLPHTNSIRISLRIVDPPR